jgi:hypothetical protein
VGQFLSFPVFDIFSYLIVGLILIATCDLIFGTQTFFHKDWGLSTTTAILITAYVLGHVVTFLSTNTFERLIVNRAMKPPAIHLMHKKDEAKPTTIEKVVDQMSDTFLALSSQYFGALEPNTQTKITAKNPTLAEACTSKGECAELYWEAYNTVKQNKEAFERLLTFNERANFCRNVSFASFVIALLVLVRLWRRGGKYALKPTVKINGLPQWPTLPAWQATIFVIVGLIMFSRYLYFYRAHTIEILTSYAYR